jgi:hypothetical protein
VASVINETAHGPKAIRSSHLVEGLLQCSSRVGGKNMGCFTLEVFASGGAIVETKIVRLPSERHVWRIVETVARKLKKSAGMKIRVKDDRGGIVALSSVSAALMVSDQLEAAE